MIDLVKYFYIYSYYDYYFYNNENLMNTIIENKESKNEIFLDFCSSIKKLFNTESMIFLEDESEKSIQKIIDKVIELDNNDDKYLEYVNKPVFSNIDFWNDNFSIETVAKKIDNVLRN